jgi:hypothetical protein
MRPALASFACFGGLLLSAALGGCQPVSSASELQADVTSASSCTQRHPGVTEIHATISVDEYRGVRSGHSGDHELIEGTIANAIWVYDSSLVDTSNVEVALNVASNVDPAGLPEEVPLAPGDTFEVEGEFIPASTANASNANGSAAVIHYTHAPCGYAVLDGTKYQ